MYKQMIINLYYIEVLIIFEKFYHFFLKINLYFIHILFI